MKKSVTASWLPKVFSAPFQCEFVRQPVVGGAAGSLIKISSFLSLLSSMCWCCVSLLPVFSALPLRLILFGSPAILHKRCCWCFERPSFCRKSCRFGPLKSCFPSSLCLDCSAGSEWFASPRFQLRYRGQCRLEDDLSTWNKSASEMENLRCNARTCTPRGLNASYAFFQVNSLRNRIFHKLSSLLRAFNFMIIGANTFRQGKVVTSKAFRFLMNDFLTDWHHQVGLSQKARKRQSRNGGDGVNGCHWKEVVEELV